MTIFYGLFCDARQSQEKMASVMTYTTLHVLLAVCTYPHLWGVMDCSTIAAVSLRQKQDYSLTLDNTG